MILHIIDDEKFLQSAIDLFEAIYPGENVFLVGVEGDGYNNNDELKSKSFVKFININTLDYNKTFEDLLNNTTLVLFHNLYKTYKLKLLKKYDIKTKIAWTFWGAELYGLNPNFNTLLPLTKSAFYKSLPFHIYIKKTILSKLKRAYYWSIFKNAFKHNKLNYTLTNISEDIDLLETYIKVKTKREWFTYYRFNQEVLSHSNNKKQHILIGNSSSETNNHLDAFELIKNKDLTDKKVYIPLNYGDKKYGNLVTNQAKTYFNEQAYPIVDFLTINEYTSIIDSCSVLIMNHKRQQAFNTIMIALAHGCKVFLREENTIFKMLKREGFVVFSIQNDLQENVAFGPLKKHEQSINLKLIQDNYSSEAVLIHIKKSIQNILNE